MGQCIVSYKTKIIRQMTEEYKTSALFNTVVQMLVRGEDPLEVIDQLITTAEDANKALIQYMYRDTRPTMSMSESKSNLDG